MYSWTYSNDKTAEAILDLSMERRDLPVAASLKCTGVFHVPCLLLMVNHEMVIAVSINLIVYIMCQSHSVINSSIKYKGCRNMTNFIEQRWVVMIILPLAKNSKYFLTLFLCCVGIQFQKQLIFNGQEDQNAR